MGLKYPIPVIDVFAGPGGLSEGFASLLTPTQEPAFDIALSIEKDRYAHSTLELRAFFRHLVQHGDPADYYDYVRGTEGMDRATLFKRHPESARFARARAWHKELSPGSRNSVAERISRARQDYPGGTPWVLLGGPPCQAYSMVGRSRMRPVMGTTFENDNRHQLYKEYLAILCRHQPDVFVMENVKGLLSSKLKSQRIFEMIIRDLRDAAGEGSYTLFSFVQRHRVSKAPCENNGYHFDPADFLIESEKYGIPQRRHRVIILGVKSALLRLGFSPQLLKKAKKLIPVARVLQGLPRLRSGRTDGSDNVEEWRRVLQGVPQQSWFNELNGSGGKLVTRKIERVLDDLRAPQAGRGDRFIRSERVHVGYQPKWFLDPRLEGVCNHQSRPHMDTDLHRYLFAACFAAVNGRTVKLGGFPAGLLPEHANVDRALRHGMFNDRFRVQVARQPATTITCHLSKDGHYAIHHDPSQCRSLTAREAARIQTFPDNYFFEGPRTQQYIQVGNAVPPLLARQLGRIVLDVLNTLVG